MTSAYAFKQYDLTASLQRFINEQMSMRADIVFDGYKYPETRPLVTIEQMQGNAEYRIKRREAVDVYYRWQIGLHASNPVERMKEQERLIDLLMFESIPYYDFDKTADAAVGSFDVQVNAVVPMPSDDIAKESKRHTVYFDVELLTTKRGC